MVPSSLNTFVVHCRRLDGGAQRVEVEHVQSGGRTRATSLTAALAWITTWSGLAEAEPAPATPPSSTPAPAAPSEPPESSAVEQLRTADVDRIEEA